LHVVWRYSCRQALPISPFRSYRARQLDTTWDEPKGGKPWVDAAAGNYTLADPKSTDTSERKSPGVDFSAPPTINNHN
jgi:hypothetical protein